MITLPIPVIGVSFEPILIIVIVSYICINLLYFNKRFRVPRAFLALLVIVNIIFLAFCFPVNSLINIQTLLNFNMGSLFFLMLHNSDNDYGQKSFFFVLCVMLITLYVNFPAIDLSKADKNILRDAGFNPNAKLNLLILFVCVQFVLYKDKFYVFHTLLTGLILVLGFVFNSRQNALAASLILLGRLNQAVRLAVLTIVLFILIFYSSVLLDYLSYYVKAYNALLGNLPSTRFEYLSEGIVTLFRNPLLPRFEHLVDNTFISIALQTNIFFGVLFSGVFIIAIIKIMIMNFWIGFAFLFLILFQDLHTESSFWLLIITLLLKSDARVHD